MTARPRMTEAVCFSMDKDAIETLRSFATAQDRPLSRVANDCVRAGLASLGAPLPGPSWTTTTVVAK